MPKRSEIDYLYELKNIVEIISDFIKQVESGKRTYIKELAGKLRVIYCKKSGTKPLIESILNRYEIEFYVYVNTNILEFILNGNSNFVFYSSVTEWLGDKGELVPLSEAIESPDLKYNGRIFNYKELFEELADDTVFHVDEEIDDDHAFLRNGNISVSGLPVVERMIFDASKTTYEILIKICKYIENNETSHFIKKRKKNGASTKSKFLQIKEGVIPFHYLKYGKNKEAIRWFEDANAKNFTIKEGHRRLVSWAYIQLGNAAQNKVLKKKFKNKNEINKDWQEITSFYKKAGEIIPEMWEASYSLANALICEANSLSRFDLQAANSRWQEANSILEKLSEKHANNPAVYILFATSFSSQASKNVDTDFEFSRDLWRKSREKYQHANSLQKLPPERLIDLALTYSKEAKHIPAINYPQTKALLEEARDLCRQLLEDERYKQKAQELISALFGEEATSASILGSFASIPLWREATNINRELAGGDETKWRFFNNLGWTLLNEARCYYSMGATYLDAVDCIKQSAEALEAALRIKPTSRLVKRNMGRMFIFKAKIHEAMNPGVSHEYWNEAEKYLRMVAKSKSHDSEAHCFLAEAIAGKCNSLANSDLEKATLLWNESDHHYEIALRINSKQHFAWNEWGSNLITRSEIFFEKDSDISTKHLTKAIDKFKSSLAATPNNINGLFFLAVSLNNLATLLISCGDKDRANALWAEAEKQVDTLIELQPANLNFYNHKGVILLDMSRHLEASDQQSFLEESKKQLLKAEKIMPGFSSYNLACAFSRQSNIEKSIYWLKSAADHGMLPSTKQIENDKDLYNIRDNALFKEWIACHT